ncbi:hypothetical protein EIP91_001337 [Steccherinum ochraceum]|uniref:Exonuclease domain-containing protein n=1 Tax=Steccherinum ochraceum TaxID=92696 RepID=A0A4V2MWI9_9APHY|nr:hypothetical protein EIP91_001337 [Steccherinum ochraceum]
MTFSSLTPSPSNIILYAFASCALFVFVCLNARRWSLSSNQAPDDNKPEQLASPHPKSLSPQSPRRPDDQKTQDLEDEDEIEMIKEPAIDRTFVKQTYEAFLVLDVEATCMPGTDFNYPNEIIEWPVLLLRWRDKDAVGRANKLEVVDQFRSFVKPTWRPSLSPFCTALTGITQPDVDTAPPFTILIWLFRDFLVRNGLIDAETGNPLIRFCWCTDGPWDIRDFVVKQCFISKIPIPHWISGDVMDVRRLVGRWLEKYPDPSKKPKPQDTRNVARIVIELARRGVRLRPNTPINPNRRWPWMGRYGKVLEHYVLYPAYPSSPGSSPL